MMKEIYKIIGALLIFIVISSCKRMEEPIFDESSSVRVSAAVENARAVIASQPKGWLIKYYPKSDKAYGGFNIFATFNSDSEVTLTSDINSDEIRSTFDIIPESGAVLTFNGYNKVIHMFSEPGADSGIGPADSGMQGDFEFVIIEATEEQIILKGKKSGNIMYMVPIESVTTEEVDVDDIIEGYREATTFFNSFGVFRIQRPNGTDEALIQNMHNFRLSSDANAAAITFRVTPEGLALYNAYEIDGVSFDVMTYVQPSADYEFGYYSAGNGRVKIYPLPTPMNVWFVSNEWYMAYSKVGPTGRIYWDNARTSLESNGLQLNEFSIGSIAGLSGVTSYILNNYTIGGLITHNLVPVPGTTDQVRISLAGTIYNYTGMTFSATYWNAGLNQLTTPFNNRTFVITTLGAIDRPRSILLTDTQIPTNTFELTMDLIADPFDN